jgi:hypothetical protein
MQILEYICKKLGTYVQSVKSLAKLLCDLYRKNPAIKWNLEPKTIKAFQKLLGYGNYYSFKKQVYAIMIMSMCGNLAEIVDDPDAHILRLLPQTIVLDPPEQMEFNSLLEQLWGELQRRTATLVLTPIGAALGAAGGAFIDKDCPPRGALILGGIGSFSCLVTGTIIDVVRYRLDSFGDVTQELNVQQIDRSNVPPWWWAAMLLGGLSPIVGVASTVGANELMRK